MKRFATMFILGSMLAFTATSCHDEEHIDTDKADSLSTMPAESPMPPPATDTVSVPPADPAMDTTAQQTPKM